MVTAVTAILKTLIPQEKTINRPEKTLWNEGLNFAALYFYIRPIKSYKVLVCYYLFLCFHICYIFLYFVRSSYP